MSINKKTIKFIFLLFLALVLLFFFILPKITFADSDSEGLLVKFNSEKDISEVSQEFGLNSDQVKEVEKINVFKLDNISTQNKLKILWDEYVTKNIIFSEPIHEYRAFLIPNDTYYSNQWALPKISAPSSWDITTGSDSIKVAIVDTGIKGIHEDLYGKVTNGWDYIHGGDEGIPIVENSDSDDNTSGYGHGTMVSGVATAITNNNKGGAGVNWLARLMPIKVLDSQGYGNDFVIAKGIIYAADNGAKVLNLSFGGASSSETLRAAIDYAYNLGCVIVAASGNDNSSISEPARYSKVIAVGATTDTDDRWVENDHTGSNYGPELAVVAPGKYIFTSINYPGYNYGYATGTSLAAPHVSGLAALIWAKYPTLSNIEITARMKENTDKPSGMGGQNFTNEYGYGRINTYTALNPTSSPDPSKYHHQWLSQNEYPSIAPGQGYNFIVNVKNTGSTTWYRGSVNLGTDRPRDRVPIFVRADLANLYGHPSYWISSNRIEMLQESVAPGETATFSFWMSAPSNMSPGTYREYFRLVADGITWMEDYGIYWDVSVDYPHAQWVGQSGYPLLHPGEETTVWIDFKNNGLTTWNNFGIHPVNLGTDRSRDRTSRFYYSDWASENRIGLSQTAVNPGEIGRFSFTINVPPDTSPGTYREYFRPVSDGLTWMEDYGVYLDVNVQ